MPESFENCVKALIADGKSEDSAYAICTAALKGEDTDGIDSSTWQLARAHFAPVNKAISYYVPFAKVDLISEDEAIVTGIATDETVDAEGEVTDYNATKEAAIEYANWRNIREMHGPAAVGVAETITLDDLTKSMSIVARIIGREPVKKIRAGIYKGFSIGGRKLAPPVVENRAGQIVKRIVKYLLTEISLVDRPANPNAIFSIVKRESENPMKDKLLKWLDFIRKAEGSEEVAAEMEETVKAMDEAPAPVEKEDNPSDPAEEDREPASEQALEDNAPTEKADEGGEPTQPAEAQQEPGEFVTPETVREIIMATLLEVGLIRQMEGSDQPMEATYKAMEKGLLPRDDFQKMVGDMAQLVNGLENLNERMEKAELSRLQSGPVLRELGQFVQPNAETSVIEKMIADTTDPALKQALGLQLTKAQIKAAQGNVIAQQP